MCTVSMIGDHYSHKWNELNWEKFLPPTTVINNVPPAVSRQEFEELKKDVLEMKELLKKAVEYDKRNNEPHCENEEKLKVLRAVAEMVGVDLEDVLTEGKNNA